MDTQKTLDDQFSKLHPCMPVNTRIGIMGAGPSGLSAAYALAKLGYNNVTVFERCQTVGGMCESAEIEGRIYDLGGQVIAANSAPVICHLAKETGSKLEEMDMHKLALIDFHTGKYEDMEVADDYVSVMSLTLKLQDEAKKSGKIGVHALSDVAADSACDFMKHHGFKHVPKSVAYGYTASGYGYVQDMPYAYIQEFTRTSMAGKIRRFKEGYTSMWHRLSQLLPFEILCNTEVLAIKRSSLGATVTLKSACGKDKVMEFDKIIISGALPFRNGRTYRSSTPVAIEGDILELNDREKQLFSKVQTVDYYTTVFKIKGLEHMPMGFYYFGEFIDNPMAMGYPVAMQRFFSDTDVFLFWSYGNAGDITGETVARRATDAVKNIGGQVVTMVLQRRFKYFPHVNSEDMKNGFYENLETELQGFQNTYYVGGLMAFELTERNSSYAMAMICRHFANDNETPTFPYIKRLFPLIFNNEVTPIRELGEHPGIEFPDLPSLDSYLKFWGIHKIMRTKTIYTWINEEGQTVNQRTYGELNANATYISHKLRTSSKPIVKPGDRVLLIYLPGLEFIDAFFGCLRAKVIPVPILPPDPFQTSGQALIKLDNISKVCGAVAILSTSSYHAAVRVGFVKSIVSLAKSNSKSSGGWPDLPWLHTDSWIKNFTSSCYEFMLNESAEDMPLELEAQPNDLCFLQFTSGSTGDAKGVMITHGGLIHNVKLMRRRYRSTSRTVLVSWLPQYHDMGLIGGLFTALVSGGTAILFSPMTFIKNPLLWLETMSVYQATHSAGPNFALELLVRRLESAKENDRKFDLSSLIFLMVAAEPVRQKTVKRFVEISRSFGLSQLVMAPGYGLAENCVFVSCAFGENEPILIDWQGRVCCGYVNSNDSDVEIRIVDPETGKEHEEGREGEIWISSHSAGIGYWGKQESSKKTFYNELEKCPGKKYTRTGDLGKILNGKLFITGRIKDLIIVGGRNVYSADVEKTVESSSDFLRPGCCAVIGVPEEILSTKGIPVPDSSDQVGLVLIAEVKEDKPIAKEILEQIRTCVAEEHGVSLAAVQLIKPRTICKTTSGKIRRFECLKQFTDGTLSLVTEPSFGRKHLLRSVTIPTCSETRMPQPYVSKTEWHAGKSKKDIIDFLKGLVSEQTGIAVEKISATESLVSYGVDSIGVVRAAQKLTDFLGVPVGAVDIFTASCISDLASFSENLLIKSQSQYATSLSNPMEAGLEFLQPVTQHSELRPLGIACLQFIALIYAATMLILPAYLSISIFLNFLSDYPSVTGKAPSVNYLVPILFAPLIWIMNIFCMCICIVLFGKSFLQPNYTLTPEISILSSEFVKWWALSKAQEVAGKVLAVHLRGTIFLNWWFEMLGAQIGSAVLIDTVDITDPSLVSIGDGAVIAEGALIQSHEARNGTLRFSPIRIGRSSYIGPYTVIQKGSILGEGSHIMPLQRTDEGKPAPRTDMADTIRKGKSSLRGTVRLLDGFTPIYHFMGIYTVGLVSSLSAAILYMIYVQLSGTSPSSGHYTFLCIAGAFHWFPAIFVAYAAIVGDMPQNPMKFAFSISAGYLIHGLILSLLTAILTQFLNRGNAETHLRAWLRHRLAVACHLRFAKLISGTEAFCVYLRLLGAQVGRHCSIRAINPVTEPALVSIGDGVHLGDFSRILPGHYSAAGGFTHGEIRIHKNTVIGSQSLVLPGSVIEDDVVLGALSVAPASSTLQRGGVYVGSPTPAMVKNTFHPMDERIEEMDPNYKKIVGNLAGNLAATTLKVRSRYFHRIGVGGGGVLKVFDSLPGLPGHKIFRPGACYPVVVRHSNSLSADDDARVDARGAALRILPAPEKEEGGDPASPPQPLLDLTLKTGRAFYARTIADFAAWLVCGLPARERQVERAPHLRDAVWGSLRSAHSYADLHYYSNVSRLLRFEDGREMYAKFKLRPSDPHVGEDSGEVAPTGVLPPETGAIPRAEDDARPLLFLADDFLRRVGSPGGVRYVLQLQWREVPLEEAERDAALDCTRPWDEDLFPYADVGEVVLDRELTPEESERLEFNPFLRCPEVDVVRATSASQSASIDHGRSLVYEICQRLRNGQPLPAAWRGFLEQSGAKVDVSGCPLAAPAPEKKPDGVRELTLARTWYQTLWSTLPQPLLQTLLPYSVIGLAAFFPLKWALLMEEAKGVPLHCSLPLFWVSSGTVASLACVLAKWVLVGRNKEGGGMLIWGWAVSMDSAWQALRTAVGDFFTEMTAGSVLFGAWMKLMGAGVRLDGGAYVDSTAAVMNPEMVEVGRGGSVGREALLFGHVYEGEGGMVRFGKIRVGEGGFVGSRAVAMPGVRVEDGGNLGALSLAMKEEVVRSR